jgi:outer membrane protein W
MDTSNLPANFIGSQQDESDRDGDNFQYNLGSLGLRWYPGLGKSKWYPWVGIYASSLDVAYLFEDKGTESRGYSLSLGTDYSIVSRLWFSFSIEGHSLEGDWHAPGVIERDVKTEAYILNIEFKADLS